VMSKHSASGGGPLFVTQASKKPMNRSSVMDCANELIENTDGTRVHSLRLLVRFKSKGLKSKV